MPSQVVFTTFLFHDYFSTSCFDIFVNPVTDISVTIYYSLITFTFSNLADTFIQSDLQMRTMEAIKINKTAMMCKCYNKSQLA